jgi:hypothetical protein
MLGVVVDGHVASSLLQIYLPKVHQHLVNNLNIDVRTPLQHHCVVSSVSPLTRQFSRFLSCLAAYNYFTMVFMPLCNIFATRGPFRLPLLRQALQSQLCHRFFRSPRDLWTFSCMKEISYCLDLRYEKSPISGARLDGV